jgi:electron transfer flavoprotein beta subunit
MRVLVCVKRVPAPGATILLNDDERSIDAQHLSFTVSPHEECATEAAVQLIEQHGGSATVLTLGPAEATEQLRYAVSVGIDAAALVPIDGSDWDPQATAAAITASVRSLEEADGPFDLILFGNESADSGGFQVGIRVAHALDRPVVSGAKGIEVDGGTVTVKRETERGAEVYRLPLPAAVAVKEGINLPRYPTLKGRLSSKQVEVRRLEAAHAPGGQSMIKLLRPDEEVSEVEILGEGAAAAPRVVDVMAELGVL